jgi:putative phosphoesterase
VLDALTALAPVVVVRGNNDQGDWAASIPETAVVTIDKLRLYVIHDIKMLDCDPVTAGFAAVISGHSHRPRVEKRQGVLFLNPGSAGPRRFKLPITVARLSVQDGVPEAEFIQLCV